MPNLAKWLIGGAVIVLLGLGAVFTGGRVGVAFGAAFYGALAGAASGALADGIISCAYPAISGDGFWPGFADGLMPLVL